MNEKAGGWLPFIMPSFFFDTGTLIFSILFFLIAGRKQTIFCNLLLASCEVGGTLWGVRDDSPCYRGNDDSREALEEEE